MATVSQSDLFTFGPFGKKPLKEQVTPHKLSVLVLIHEYCTLKKDETAPFVFGMEEEQTIKFTEMEKRNFMTTILALLQSADLTLKELSLKIRDCLKSQLYEAFCDRLQEFQEEGIRVIQDFFQSLSYLTIQETQAEPMVSKSSVLGIFIRRMIVAFDKLTFSQVMELHAKFLAYFEAGGNLVGPEESKDFGGSLTDSAMSLSGIRFNRSGFGRSLDAMQLTDTRKADEDPGGFYSQKQAEFFISKQGFLLQHNEGEAQSSKKLQEKIQDMLKANPEMAEAHFLSYLNSLRLKEYCTALDNLYHYFDRNSHMGGDSSGAQGSKNREENACRRYAALNLATLHYRFGHKEESMAALHEAIRLAQETNDHVCLQHALGWLHRLGDQGSAHTANLMERAVAKSSELNLPNLTSLGVQALARHNAFAGAKPGSVFEYLQKSDVLNCQHSQSGFMCMSYAQKAALWKLYGKRECSSAASQLVLNLDTSESGIYFNGEAICLALCALAKLHADNGQYTAALDLINNAKKRFPESTHFSAIWMTCEQEILFDRTLLNRKWNITEQAAMNLRALDPMEARIRGAIMNKEKGEVTIALDQLHDLLTETKKDKENEITPDFPCRVLLTLAELYIQTNNTTTAINYVTECITHAKQHHLQYMVAMATIHLAYIQLLMQLPEQAMNLLEQHMLTVLSNGSVYDKARVLYGYARCRVALGSKQGEQQKKDAILASVTMLGNVIDLFQSVEAFFRVKDALYYQARLYHELGYESERNKCAYKFKQLDQQYATLSKMQVNVL